MEISEIDLCYFIYKILISQQCFASFYIYIKYEELCKLVKLKVLPQGIPNFAGW